MARSPTQRGASSIADRAVSGVRRAWGESVFYQARLNGPAPDRLACRILDPYTPDGLAGEAIAGGRLAADWESLDCEGELARAFDRVAREGPLHHFLHGFGFLRPLSALGERGRAPAVALARAWLDRHEKWSPDSWLPALTAARLEQLCCHGGLVLTDPNALWRSRLMTSMARQTRHLALVGHRVAGADARLSTAFALTLAGLALPGCEPPMERGLELLRRELRLQLRPDGGHISRNPSRQLGIVCRLQMVLKAMEDRRLERPGFLRHMASRASAHLQLFRVGDGRLAAFNGGYEDDPRALLAALDTGEHGAEPVGFARQSGFQRLETSRSVLICDVGASSPGESDAPQFDGGASFQFSTGRTRMVVNCGAGAHLPGEWSEALRQVGAHSTLCADSPCLVENLLKGGAVAHRRAEDERGHLLEIERAFGPAGQGGRHVRRLFLTAAGSDLRGEDALFSPTPALAAGWRLRFHLHPSVKASLARDGSSVLLALGNGEGWRFRAARTTVALERSVYCGARGAPAACEQIVLSRAGLEPASREDMVIKWGFRRLDAPQG